MKKYRLKSKPEVLLEVVPDQAVFKDDTGVELTLRWDQVEAAPASEVPPDREDLET